MDTIYFYATIFIVGSAITVYEIISRNRKSKTTINTIEEKPIIKQKKQKKEKTAAFSTAAFSSTRENGLVTVRVDSGEYYHTQRNNLVRPMGTCASTSMAMALRYSGYNLSFIPSKTQDEDYITNFIHTDPKVVDFWKNNEQKWMRDAYVQYLDYKAGNRIEDRTTFGNEIHEVMQFAINTLIGKKVDKFSYQWQIHDILFNLLSGGAVVTSGLWPFKGGRHINHVVCLAGFKTTQENILDIKDANDIDVSLVDSFILDDPFGDYRATYTSESGNDVKLPYNDYIEIIKDPGNKIVKWGHLISKA